MTDDEGRRGFPRLRVRRSRIMQNLASEIEAAQSDIRRVVSAVELPEESKATVDRCSELLLLVIEDYNGRFPHELFIWESLFQIQQDLLLVLPSDQLLAEWDVFQTRISTTQEKGTEFPWEESRLNELAEQLKSLSGSTPSDRGVRPRVREIRKYLDDRVVFDLWRSIQIRKFGYSFACLAFALGTVLAVTIYASACQPSQCMADSEDYILFGMIVAGSLGASLSALAGVTRFGQDGVPLLSGLQLVRPVVGAVSGLVLYLIWQTEILHVHGVELYLFAIGFGFSERALFELLGRLAKQMEGHVERPWRT